MASKTANRVPMADTLVWARVMRPHAPIVYLDLNHFIGMARANSNKLDGQIDYGHLLRSARQATREGRALVVLSGQHLYEMVAIKDPRQRRDVAEVMEDLSGFQYLLGRPEIARLEIESGIETVLQEKVGLDYLPLLGPSFGWAFGMRGGLRIVNDEGEEASADLRKRIGRDAFDTRMREANHYLERRMLEGPTDIEAVELRASTSYSPETARTGQQSRLDFELELSRILAMDPKWRKGRLRDVVSAREIAHEWSSMILDVNRSRVETGKPAFDLGDPQMSEFMAAMPHTQVAISMKTRYHQDPNHHWTTNDIVDIDALSVAFAYCDVVFTDRAARAALTLSTELRVFGTYVPRTPIELSEWFDSQPRVGAAEHILVPAGSRLP